MSEASDNTGAAATCAGCAARDRRVAELEARVAGLEAKLGAAVRAGKRQAAPFSKGPPKADPKPPGRKAGEDYGTHSRRAVPERIDERYEAALPECCTDPGCPGRVRRTGVAQQYQAEITRRCVYRRFDVAVGECDACGRRVQGRHPLQASDALGAAASQVGPDAQALAVLLNKGAGLSHGKVKAFFKDAFDLDLSRSASCRVMLRVAGRCEPAYASILARLRASPWAVPDETGWRICGQPAWMHVAVGGDVTAYLAHRRRGYEAAVGLLGEDYEGFLTHDGWKPYDRFAYATHQTCLGHLLRRSGELIERAKGRKGAAAVFPRRVKSLLQEALEVRDGRDAGGVTPQQAAAAAKALSGRMAELTASPRLNPDNERFAEHLSNQHNSLFTFLEFQGVDATNHKAEQAIRPAVVNRKVWGGNRTDPGARAQSVLMSVLRTAAQRGVDSLHFLSSTIKSRLGQQPQLLAPTAPDTG